MEDRDIVTLYWQRDQEAIRQTDRQYGRYLSSIAFHILADCCKIAVCTIVSAFSPAALIIVS